MYIIVILKAIHNKDYSVVKTFRAALFRVSSSLFVKSLKSYCLNFNQIRKIFGYSEYL